MDDKQCLEILMEIKDEVGNLNTKFASLFPPGTPSCKTHEFRLRTLERWKWGFVGLLMTLVGAIVNIFIKGGGTPHG